MHILVFTVNLNTRALIRVKLIYYSTILILVYGILYVSVVHKHLPHWPKVWPS